MKTRINLDGNNLGDFIVLCSLSAICKTDNATPQSISKANIFYEDICFPRNPFLLNSLSEYYPISVLSQNNTLICMIGQEGEGNVTKRGGIHLLFALGIQGIILTINKWP